MPNALFKRFNGTSWEEFKFSAYDSEKLGGVLPSGYALASHSHAISDVLTLQTALDGKAASVHGHVGTDITLTGSPVTVLGTTHFLTVKDVNNNLLYANINFNATHNENYLRRDGTWQALQIASIVNLQTSLNAKLNLTGGTMTGQLLPQNNTAYTTGQARRIVLSTANPSGGGNGDVWIKYIA